MAKIVTKQDQQAETAKFPIPPNLSQAYQYRYVSVAELGPILRCSPQTVRNYINNRFLKVVSTSPAVVDLWDSKTFRKCCMIRHLNDVRKKVYAKT